MVILPFGSMDEARELEADFEEAITNNAGVSIDIVLVERYASALAALCASGGGDVSVAWLDGITYRAATAQNCGIPALQVQRGGRGENATGAPGQIIISRVLGTTEISALQGRTFCRLGYDDFYSWLIPSLIMETNGIDPLTDLDDIVDYDDRETLLQDIISGDCTATGIAEPTLDTLIDENPDLRDGVRVVETSISFPYRVLVLPIEVPLGIRLALIPTLIDMANDPQRGEMMHVFLGQDSLRRVTPDDFEEFEEFMASLELDFSQLGN